MDRQEADGVRLHAGMASRGVLARRHDAETRMVQSKLTLHDVAHYLGHSIETTQTYAKWADDSLQRTLEGWSLGKCLHPNVGMHHVP